MSLDEAARALSAARDKLDESARSADGATANFGESIAMLGKAAGSVEDSIVAIATGVQKLEEARGALAAAESQVEAARDEAGYAHKAAEDALQAAHQAVGTFDSPRTRHILALCQGATDDAETAHNAAGQVQLNTRDQDVAVGAVADKAKEVVNNAQGARLDTEAQRGACSHAGDIATRVRMAAAAAIEDINALISALNS